MFNWLRKIPHPHYGKCGGANRDCSPSGPIDEIDEAFDLHDDELHAASLLTDPIKQKTARQVADKSLYIRLRDADPKKLKWRGRLYRRLAMVAFKK